MELIEIKNTSHPLFSKLWEVYTYSFPSFERRSLESQKRALEEDGASILVALEDNCFIGFLIYWQFTTFVFLEHYALSKESRGKGFGTTILKNFISMAGNKMVILDIDVPCDDISIRRERFYHRLGFVTNSHKHFNPPYNLGEEEFELKALSLHRELTVEEFKDLTNKIKTIIVR